jgi:hypothetical protein
MCQDLGTVCDYKETWGFGLVTGFIGHLHFLITIHYIWPYRQFTESVNHYTSTEFSQSPYQTLVPASNGECSLFWVSELSPCHSHSNS